MNPRVLILLIGLIVVLFAVGVALGATGQGGPVPDSAPAVLEGLGGFLGVNAPLSSGDVDDATCPPGWRQLLQGRGPLTLTGLAGGTCVLEIAPSSTPIRTLALALERGSSDVLVRYESAGERVLEMEQTLSLEADDPQAAPNDTIKLQFLKEGGTLGLACRGTRCELVTRDPDEGP
jgi:hypothetical protein